MRDGIFVQKEKTREVYKGGLVEGQWWVDGKGVAEMAGERC